MYSAIKKDGVKLYELARKGKEIERTARDIEIYEIELLDFDADTFKMRVLCSKGTYIRSLAEDIGKKLGTGAVLTELRRTKTAGFDISECVSLEALSPENIKGYLHSAERAVLGYPLCEVSEKQADRFANGGELDINRLRLNTSPKNDMLFRVKSKERFLGLGRIKENSLKVECLTWHSSDEQK